MFFVIMTLYLLIQSYILWRFYQMLPEYCWLKRISGIFMLLLTISMPLTIFFGKVLPLSVMRPFYLVGGAWMVGLIYFLIPVLLIDIFRMINHFTRWISSSKIDAFRRDNGWLCLILLMIYSGVFYYGNQQYHQKVRQELFIDLTTQTALASPLACQQSEEGESHRVIKTVMVSDLHLGHTIGRNELEAWVKLLNAEEADYIFISGDLIDNDVRPLYHEKIEEVLDQLHAKRGVYAVLGNHEYLAGMDNSIAFIAQTNMTLLRDEVILLPENIYLVGRDDRMNAQRASLASLIEGLDADTPMIVLDHQPKDLQNIAGLRPFLQFSGHTHDGQIWPYKHLAKWINGLSSGLVKVEGSQFLVSSGLGIWGGKFRIGTRSEYLVVNICQ